MIRGVRGAITVSVDQPEEVLKETQRLVLEMAKENNIEPDDVASVIISTTTDISSAFPAKAVRTIAEWTYVPVMCTHEMDVPGSMPLCIRVMMHVNTVLGQQDIHHIYLNEAIKLRPDLSAKSQVSST
ncbi:MULTISPECIES: chorismate mutase [Planococcus]|uniref:chorismate mutase n=2 Tax=Planococcus TaxID=1372 RepID=A0ABM5WVK3_9BACL|nr:MULTISPECIES: chorismate mutase [Planococcus]ALS78385.1 chorismate mutase [Planococcus kocurii]AQU79635.1 chorismate mutase [Planococcus faecalis]KAA0958205.1 chorismate mutase [Planococcus sp. ANT_H30]MDJ0331663.1 chorismate mutase [Planococcus sp. S3-L1]OHX51556.1 chorismate mutase [Planococcus faecalis]